MRPLPRRKLLLPRRASGRRPPRGGLLQRRLAPRRRRPAGGLLRVHLLQAMSSNYFLWIIVAVSVLAVLSKLTGAI